MLRVGDLTVNIKVEEAAKEIAKEIAEEVGKEEEDVTKLPRSSREQESGSYARSYNPYTGAVQDTVVELTDDIYI